MFVAKIVADSIDPAGIRLTTFQLSYPRFIHSELMTHRVLSRNAMSSRAVPVQKIIDQILDHPAMPVHWGKNQPGMQAKAEVDDIYGARALWCKAANAAVKVAEDMIKMGLHKQVANRILEPYQWMNVIVTATEWDNFWDLRCHPDADPNFQLLATMMEEVYLKNTPRQLQWGEWHLPYISDAERQSCLPLDDLIKFSVARCARVSFNNHDGSCPDQFKDCDLHDKLVVQKPAHASPAEHQACAKKVHWFRRFMGQEYVFIKNFRNFRQYRDYLEKEETV